MSDSKITCPQCGAWLNIHPGGSCSSCGWERPVTTAGQTYDRDALAALIERTQYGDEALPTPSSYGYALADAILAAGWRAPEREPVYCQCSIHNYEHNHCDADCPSCVD